MSFAGGELEDLAATVARRTAPVFKAMNWEWRDVGVPDEAQIASCVSRLLTEAAKDPGSTHSTGRFSVSYWIEEPHECVDVSLQVGELDQELDRG